MFIAKLLSGEGSMAPLGLLICNMRIGKGLSNQRPQIGLLYIYSTPKWLNTALCLFFHLIITPLTDFEEEDRQLASHFDS